MKEDIRKPNPVEEKPKLEVSFGEQVEYVKVNDQVTTKGKNNKKKIQPAMLVRKD